MIAGYLTSSYGQAYFEAVSLVWSVSSSSIGGSEVRVDLLTFVNFGTPNGGTETLADGVTNYLSHQPPMGIKVRFLTSEEYARKVGTHQFNLEMGL
jgi:hypothetical protein